MSASRFYQHFVPALAIALALATVGCSHSSANTSTQSAPSAAPVYPGAKVEAANLSSAVGAGAASESAYSTSDSFDTVYAFYKKNLPAGSEQSHVTSPEKAAVFLVGTGNDRLTVSIAASPLCCKTLIVIAHAKA